MKTLFLTFILTILTLFSFSQKDSTTIYYQYNLDNDIRTICAVSEIQFERLICADTLMRGKEFNIIIKEYKKGKLHSTINLNTKTETERVKMLVDRDTIYTNFSFSPETKFDDSDDSFKITIVSKFNYKNINCEVNYPSSSSSRTLKGKKDYHIVHLSYAPFISIPLNEEYPVLAYTPPFNPYTKDDIYIYPGVDNVFDWYKQFGVKHYYVFFLEILV